MAKSGTRDTGLTYFGITPPQDGGWSLTPMENMLRGLRDARDFMAYEVSARDGVVSYSVRCSNGTAFNGVFHSFFPQAQIRPEARPAGGAAVEGDWLFLDEDEYGLVQTLSLARENHLPLQTFEDRLLESSATDPLAGLIGILSSGSRTVGGAEGGDRLGVRLLLKPAPSDWAAKFQAEMQKRRDGEDRAARPGSPEAPGPNMGAVLGFGGFAGLAGLNYWLYTQGQLPLALAVDACALTLGAFGLVGWKKWLKGSPKRQYMDEVLVESKLKALCFYSELQLVRIFRDMADEGVARGDLEKMVHCLRGFDDPAGNGWKEGRVLKYSGQLAAQGDRRHPFQGGFLELGWLDRRGSDGCVLSAREAASLWHLPLGDDDMAPMERTASGSLSPYLGDLSDLGEDGGPLVGLDDSGNGIRLPESAIRKHGIILGRSGVGKSTLLKQLMDYKMARKAQGKDDTAIVVIDPHADLVRDMLKLVPPEIADKVRLLDFGREDRVPAMNLVDPELFPARDRCVDTIVTTIKNLYEAWGNRLEDLLTNALLIIYEYNMHPETKRSEMLTLLDVVSLLEDGVVSGTGRNAKTSMSAEQERILSRVQDGMLRAWFNTYLGWPPDQRAEAVAPVRSRIGAYARSESASVVLGQRESTIVLSDVLDKGLILLVSTASGTVGKQVAAILGGSMVSLVESVLRDQERLPPGKRKRLLLMVDEFQTITGADWESLFAEIRKYGCSMMLATQSLARLSGGERRLKEGVLGNVGLIVAYQMSADDARIVAPEMDSSRIEERNLGNLNPHHCYVRLNTDRKCYPVFSMKTLPPPDEVTGSDECEARVLEQMVSYTVDRADARARLMEEYARRMELSGKVGAPPRRPRQRDREGGSSGSNGNGKGAGGEGGLSSGLVPVVEGASGGDGDDGGLTEEDRKYLATSDDDPLGAPPVVRPPPRAGDDGDASGGNGVSGGDGAVGGLSAGLVPADVDAVPAGDVPVSRGLVALDGGGSGTAGPAAALEGDGGGGRRRRDGDGDGDRIASGSLRGIRKEHIAQSKLKREDLEYLCSLASNDTGLRALLDKRLGDQLSKARRDLRKELEAGIETEVSRRVEQEVDSRLGRLREEERLKARVELGISGGGQPAAAEVSDDVGGGGESSGKRQAWVPRHLRKGGRG